MKNLLLLPIVAVLLFSCNSNTADRQMSVADQRQFSIDSMKMVMDQQVIKLEKQKSIDSMQMIMAKPAIAATPTRTVNYVRTHANPVVEAPVQAVQPQKKGWSNLAKGAVIGAGVGAIGGAIINKKKPANGALLGGLIGAGAGAGVGAILDAKKKKKLQEQQGFAYAY